MRCKSTHAVVAGVAGAIVLAALGPLAAQTPASGTANTVAEWRRIGSLVSNDALVGSASGRVDRVWYAPGVTPYSLSGEGLTISIVTHSGRRFDTADLEVWQPATGAPPPAEQAAAVSLPEAGAQVRRPFAQFARLYAFGEYVYRSNDGGRHWENVVLYQGASILGGAIRDLAISPNDADQIVAAGDSGVFRSTDAGLSWTSLNAALPNLPASRILRLPAEGEGARVAISETRAAEWPPGEKQEWIAASAPDLAAEVSLRRALSVFTGIEVTAVATAGDFIYIGSNAGEIRVSSDRGATWRAFLNPGSGAVERFWVDASDARIAVAALGSAVEADDFRASVHVMHTMNGGAIWDDITGNLPDAPGHGIAADVPSGAIYAATGKGVFVGYMDLANVGAVPVWTQVGGLPAAAALDVKLDAQGHQLWTVLDGLGVYAALAPHRLLDPKVVSAADLLAHAAAPGALITVVGAQVHSARAGDLSLPILASTPDQSQLQVPFEASGTSVTIAAATQASPLTLGPLPLAKAAPVIFVDRDGTPLVLDADNGLMLDGMTPAHSGTRIQILATGLGRVTPEWATGLPAPFENAPRVAGAVHAYLDRAPIEVTRATLAPGYVGFYLIEITVPKLVDYGPAELYVDVDGISSNRVQTYIEP